MRSYGYVLLVGTCLRRFSLSAASARLKATMDTKITTDVEPAVAVLKAGRPIGMPTETVYGLAANALNADAAAQIFTVKGRPSDNPLICHISSLDMLNQVCSLTFAFAGCGKFWKYKCYRL